jgi:hypothetical protein
MQITCNHPQSSDGIPVILDDYGNPYHYQPGVEAVLVRLGWTLAAAAHRAGFPTDKNEEMLWNSGSPSMALLAVLKEALEESHPESISE